MAEDTILITVRDRDPLVVDKQRLVESSSVFSYIIVDCSQTEHDMTDFSPEIVEIFLTLLEDKKVDQIEESDFRQLHKISVVFNVQWLIDSCREWLLEKINNVGEVIDYESLFFLFDECYYIHSKWNVTHYMVTLILEVRFKDNSLFLSPYIRENYDQLSTDQLKFLLYLAGSNTKVFLELINSINRINSEECLDDRTRYLLKHMNLSLCVQQNEHQLYGEMSVRLAEMSDMSNDDLRLILKLTAEATIEASDRKNNISSTTRVNDGITLFDCRDYHCLADITYLITEDKISSMYEVIDLLAKVASNNALSTEEIEKFVESLENLSPNKPLQNIASTQYADTLITALEFSDNDNKHQCINLLTMIRNSDKLSSCYDNICLVGEETTQSTVVNSLKNFPGLENQDRFVYRMKHPGVTDCKGKGDCGFIIKPSELEGREYYEGYELSKEAADYTDSGVHVHDVIRAGHMYWYWILTGTTRGGNTVRLPGRWRSWRWWWRFSEVTSWKITEYCVDYNIRDHLVAKY